MSNLPILYVIILLLAGLLMPVMGVINGPKVRPMLDSHPERRVSVYLQTIIMLFFLGGLVLLAMWLNQQPLETIGAQFLANGKSLLILLAICLGFLLLINLIKPREHWLPGLKQTYHQVMYLLPASTREYRTSILMAFAAGFSEEIVFRGFLFHQINLLIPIVPSVILVNLIFGLCHWGTGIKNATWSFLLGVTWSLTYLWTESLWIPVLTHILVDLLSMTLGYQINKLRADTLIQTADSR